MTADHEAQRQATDQGAAQAIRRGLSRLFETSQSGADQLILSALAEAGYTVVKTEDVRWEYEARWFSGWHPLFRSRRGLDEHLAEYRDLDLVPDSTARRFVVRGPWVPVPEGSADRGSEEGGER